MIISLSFHISMGHGASKAKKPKLSLEQLPGEMLVAVASCLDNFNDLLAFAFASRSIHDFVCAL